MIAIETALNIEVSIIVIQKLFISNWDKSHDGFNFYWPQGKRKNIKVMTSVRKNLTNKIVIDHRTNLINHLLLILLETQELDS